MPDHLAPGVYIEEIGLVIRSISGVPTSTTAFVGPTRSGPGPDSNEPLPLLTSFGDFERRYGGVQDLGLDGMSVPNHVAHAALGFFREGGRRLHVARAVGSGAARSAVTILDGGTDASSVRIRSRYAGRAGDGTVSLGETLTTATAGLLEEAPPGTLLRTGAGDAPSYHLKVGDDWSPVGGPAAGSPAMDAILQADPRLVSLLVVARDSDGRETSWGELGFEPRHPRAVGQVLGPASSSSDPVDRWFDVFVGGDLDVTEVLGALFAGGEVSAVGTRHRIWTLEGGDDGSAPDARDYEAALERVAALEDVAIVAAPGSSAGADAGQALAVTQALIAHVEAPDAYRMAVLDPPPGSALPQVRDHRAAIDSRHAALYYPWIMTANPNARPGRPDIPTEIAMPPSGYLCGIYARSDLERGVHKAPANEIVRSALRLETGVGAREQEVLNPLGVNCIRHLPGAGYRVWGARTVSSDPEWKYVAVRRYVTWLEASIDRGTRWVVFETNDEPLWAGVVRAVDDFLQTQWRAGALHGAKPEEAYFVRCDRSTMTQNDVDEGRLICEIGVALMKPAEFVIFRIGQKTAEVAPVRRHRRRRR